MTGSGWLTGGAVDVRGFFDEKPVLAATQEAVVT
jgi:hypothetical protein